MVRAIGCCAQPTPEAIKGRLPLGDDAVSLGVSSEAAQRAALECQGSGGPLGQGTEWGVRRGPAPRVGIRAGTLLPPGSS